MGSRSAAVPELQLRRGLTSPPRGGSQESGATQLKQSAEAYSERGKCWDDVCMCCRRGAQSCLALTRSKHVPYLPLLPLNGSYLLQVTC